MFLVSVAIVSDPVEALTEKKKIILFLHVHRYRAYLKTVLISTILFLFLYELFLVSSGLISNLDVVEVSSLFKYYRLFMFSFMHHDKD